LGTTPDTKLEQEVVATFGKCEANILVLERIKDEPNFAKKLQELSRYKQDHRLQTKRVPVSEHVSAIYQQRMPEKFDDPCMFTIPIQIGRFRFRKALLDIGASINVVPYQVYVDLDMGPMSKTDIEFQLADGSFVYPRGVVEDVLVQVQGLVFP